MQMTKFANWLMRFDDAFMLVDWSDIAVVAVKRRYRKLTPNVALLAARRSSRELSFTSTGLIRPKNTKVSSRVPTNCAMSWRARLKQCRIGGS